MESPVQRRLDRLVAAHPAGDDGTGALAVAVATVGGDHYTAGPLEPVALASLAAAVVHALAVEDLGPERVGEAVATMPRADEAHRLELEPGTGRPLNALQNAGVVALAGLLKGRGGRDRAARLLQLLAALIGRETLSLIHIPSPRDVEEDRMPSSA